MAIDDGTCHARDGAKSITLENAANSNKPNNLKNKEQESEEENNPMMIILQTILENQTKAQTSANNMQNTITSLRNDIQKIKNNNEETIDMAKQAIAKSNEAQTTAEEAKETSKDNKLKINKAEQDIKTIKYMQQEINNYKVETSEEIKEMKSNMEQTKKDISAATNKIEDIFSSIDVINRELAAKASTNISDDNPDPLAITYAFMASKAPPPQVQQPITKPLTKEEQQKQQELKT